MPEAGAGYAKLIRMATVVAFHAHPDDEVLLSGGTLAHLAARGHRVVIVVACDGVVNSAAGQAGRTRLDDLRASAAVLGAARVVHLGYADSGHGPVLFPDPPDRARFVRADRGEAAARLAALLREEHADVLLSYDPRGGYGHRDHVRVHEVGALAAELTGVRVLEATLPRELVNLLSGPVRLLRLAVRYDPAEIRVSFTPRAAITHRLSVRRYAAQKRAALAAHMGPGSAKAQAGVKGRSRNLFRVILRLPVPVFGLLPGFEWYAEPGVARTGISREIV